MQKSQLTAINDIMSYSIDKYLFGTGDGPKLMVTGGIHGGEVTGIHTCNLLIKWLEEKENALKGQVMVLPICNPAGFRRMQRTSPYDDQDMNRIFPGNPEGSPTRQAAALVYAEAAWADYIVDLHCCGVYGSPYTLSIYKESEKDKELARMLDIPVVVESGGTAGQLFVEASRKMGKAAVIIELPGGQPLGKVDLDAVDLAYNALLGLIRQLGMISEPATKPAPVFTGKIESVRCPTDGYFEPCILGGNWVKAGDCIGKLNGEEVKVAKDCRIMNIGPARYLFKNGSLYSLVVAEK